MEPGHEDREDLRLHSIPGPLDLAAMEPGHEDREDLFMGMGTVKTHMRPQWSPVTKTGKTARTYRSG